MLKTTLLYVDHMMERPSSTIHRLMRACGAVLPASTLAGCAPGDITCGSLPTPGVVMTIIDAADRRVLNATAQVAVRQIDGQQLTETGNPIDALQITARPGRFEVTVSVPQYTAVTDTFTVRYVKSGRCEVTSQETETVALFRAP